MVRFAGHGRAPRSRRRCPRSLRRPGAAIDGGFPDVDGFGRQRDLGQGRAPIERFHTDRGEVGRQRDLGQARALTEGLCDHLSPLRDHDRERPERNRAGPWGPAAGSHLCAATYRGLHSPSSRPLRSGSWAAKRNHPPADVRQCRPVCAASAGATLASAIAIEASAGDPQRRRFAPPAASAPWGTHAAGRL